MTKHNKKRNVGIVYEMLMNYITESVIDNRHSDAKKAVKIVERRYNKNTELYKEFRLLNALANSTVSGTHIAAGVLAEAKSAARNFDQSKLMKEKSLLIKDINYQLGKDKFYNSRIPNYKTYATIQTLINEWSAGDRSDLSKVINYEKLIVEHLLEEKETKKIEFDERSDALVLKIMTENINKKYINTLTEEQKDILKNYALYCNDSKSLSTYLSSVKKKTLNEVDQFSKKTKNTILLSKVDAVYQKINELSVENQNDETIMKYMTLSKLKDQLIKGDSNE
jgi:hypothetical protein